MTENKHAPMKAIQIVRKTLEQAREEHLAAAIEIEEALARLNGSPGPTQPMGKTPWSRKAAKGERGDQLVDLLRTHGAMSVGNMAKATGLSTANVSYIIRSNRGRFRGIKRGTYAARGRA